MRVLVVSCVYPPEPVVSAQTSFQIAIELSLNNDVEVITTFPNRPGGQLYPGYRRRLFLREVSPGGYDLTRCYSVFAPESSILRRFFENLSFGITSGVAVLLAPRPNVIYANTWPIFASGILCLVAKLRGIPVVISVQDLYPESMVVQGRIQHNNLVVRWMRWADGKIARVASHVIVISERFADIYRDDRRVPTERLSVVPNWAQDSADPPADRAISFRRIKNIKDDEFVVAYGGNIGVAAGVEAAIEAMSLLTAVNGLRLVIAGDGSRLAACRELARGIGENRVVIHSPWLADETYSVLQAADVLLLPTRGQQSLVSLPSKLIAYMLAGRPVIAQAIPGSDLARIIKAAGCGWVVAPDRPTALAATIKDAMALSPAERISRGRAGREYAIQNLTRSACLPRVIGLLERVANGRSQ